MPGNEASAKGEGIMKLDSLSGGELIELPVDKLEACDWNPQVMSETMFNQLVEEIRDDGFDEPLLVVPHPEPNKAKDGFYRIIAGEHRYEAVKVLGFEHVPAIVKPDWDETEQKLKTVRRNMLRGSQDPVKFSRLVKQVNDDDGVPLSDIPQLMGFDDDKVFKKLYIAEKEKEDEAVANAAKKDGEEQRREMEMIDNLSYILNQIFSNYGDTVPAGFLFFWYKNRQHLMVQEDTKLEKKIEHLVRYCKAQGTSMQAILDSALDAEFKRIFAKTRINPMSMRGINEDDDAEEESPPTEAEEIDFGGENDEAAGDISD
jgi:ParB/RepB/Spo0J family partition protein